MMRAVSGAGADGCSKLPRGALEGAPRRDTTMTQNSDSGDAAGDAGPTNRHRAGCRLTVKIGLTAESGLPFKSPRNHIELHRIKLAGGACRVPRVDLHL